MPEPSNADRILAAATSWEGVTAAPHRFGGTEFRLGRREIGHVHGNRLVDIPFPSRVRVAVIEAGEAEPHHLLPDTGWVSIYLRQPADVDRAIELLHRSYGLALGQKQRPAVPPSDSSTDLT